MGTHQYAQICQLFGLVFSFLFVLFFSLKDYLAYFNDSKYEVISGHSLKLQGTDPQINSSIILLYYSLKTSQDPNHTAAVSVRVNSKTDNI